MRILPFILGLILTLALIIALDRKWGAVPPLGRFLSPQQGFWQNAEPADAAPDETLSFPGLKGAAHVYIDERLVPHVFAEHDEDAYFIQGYLHARYRLWQMELQTFAAAGRISEKMGNNPAFIAFDREQRREGMTWAAEKALEAFEADPRTKSSCDAYTAGVNAYIGSLTQSSLPLEYKLLHYRPEPWTNLKTALFLKQMSKTLSGYDEDMEKTATKGMISFEELLVLDPQVPDSLEPIIPRGTPFDMPTFVAVAPPGADSLYFEKKDTVHTARLSAPDPTNGSNNWVVGGSKTASGAPILCNDPHLELSFPSIWYEMQLVTPNMNVYGATFPGSPSVIIGFNDHISWGVTNAQRDVRDYFEIEFRDASMKEYRFDSSWRQTEFRVETIKVREGVDIVDSVPYTVFGPVMYDRNHATGMAPNKAVALRWTAHDASNEGLTFYLLNRAKDYDSYLEAIRTFSCPGQNFAFAAKSGDIAIWQQGKFPARWFGQGTYLMPGKDSSYMWPGFIPQGENPHIMNPAQGFVQSANQRPVDSTYPYFIPGNYITARGVAIHKRLTAMQGITPQDMMSLQNDTYSVFGAGAKALLLPYVKDSAFSGDEKKYFALLRDWDGNASATSTGTTVFQVWIDSLEKLVWEDHWAGDTGRVLPYPDEQTLLEILARDSASHYVDDLRTPAKESLYDIATLAFQKASKTLQTAEDEGRLEWSAFKAPRIKHLLGSAVPSFSRPVKAGGWGNTINALTTSHGPSWRMIVHLSPQTEAYGIYPGGQSGNPGSRFYDNSVADWAAGKYYPLWMMKESEGGDKRIIGKISFTKS